MPIASLEDCDIYYEEHGSGFPLMLVSGLGGVGSYWTPQLEEFSRHYRVIIHDHRGTGQSSKPRSQYSVEQMSRDTIGLMDALKIDKAHFVGHSTGGAIGQVLCVLHPERMGRVVMYATWTKADAFFRRCFEIRRELLLKSGPEAYVQGALVFLRPSWWIRDSGNVPEPAGSTVYGAELDVEIVDSRIQALLEFDWRDRLAEISSPVLVLGVKNDHLTPAYFSEDLASLIPKSQLLIMPDGAHTASQILPEEFNRIVLDYLRES